MKKKKINIGVALFGFFLTTILLILYGVNLKNEKIQQDRKRYKEGFLADKKYQNLIVTDIEKTTDHLIATLSNRTDSIYFGEEVEVIFLSTSGEVVCNMTYRIPQIDAHSNASLNMVLEQKCKNAYTFVLNKKEEDKNE